MNILKQCMAAVVFSLLAGFSLTADAKELHKEEMNEFLQSAFAAQVSLSERERSLDEMQQILKPYFSENFIETYLKQQAVQLDGGYIVYGTDFSVSTIPFYSYNNKTIMVENSTSILVHELFPAPTEGPVYHEDMYGSVNIEKTENGPRILSIIESKEVLELEDGRVITEKRGIHPEKLQLSNDEKPKKQYSSFWEDVKEPFRNIFDDDSQRFPSYVVFKLAFNGGSDQYRQQSILAAE
ncbi:DUF3993 domain-containing protein [Bacillus lacus]|uniref:DUF3993 domain-containing protein n=1 Tax=Metabacillus lacus TaxID=1983721 RepID=A0A7X2J1Z0_9BACI|nr:DUF3993 domain-containing protein [Metabacillus lacus]MRX73784.1 DUF3993 domain-containing protein [Metabacillus lacus]